MTNRRSSTTAATTGATGATTGAGVTAAFVGKGRPGAFLTAETLEAFLAGAFFTGAFLAAAFFTGVFFAGAFLGLLTALFFFNATARTLC